MLKTFLTSFLELLFLESYVMQGAFGEHCPLTKLFYGVHFSFYYQFRRLVERVIIIEPFSSTK
jgi:hypothetical protein